MTIVILTKNIRNKEFFQSFEKVVGVAQNYWKQQIGTFIDFSFVLLIHWGLYLAIACFFPNA